MTRIRLRRLRPSDAPALAAYRSRPEVARYQSWSDDFSLADAEALTAHEFGVEGEWSQLGVVRDNDLLIGDVGIHFDGARAEIGFTFAPEFQRHGYATEAVRAVVELLRKRGIREVIGVVDARNVSAIALLHRVGFALQRTETAEFKGAPCEEHVFALTLASPPAAL
jgi:RimJ/RimL family protein N-acetyltransferase